MILNNYQDCRARLPGKTAGQDCRARLPGKTVGQDCRASLPGKTAGQDCRARLPGKTAGQDCRARLLGKTAGQDCQARIILMDTLCQTRKTPTLVAVIRLSQNSTETHYYIKVKSFLSKNVFDLVTTRGILYISRKKLLKTLVLS
jgi:hypothetical protein